ncbi:MAG: hypothetical protein IKX17_07470, partial [Prevotella sp.]|nr:hypothetical protein [Prevotella sp.]
TLHTSHSTLHTPHSTLHENIPILACNGRLLTLPEKPATLDANTLAIETLQGTLVATRPWRGNQTDVSTLPEGFYQLRSLGRKGITHRFGFFQIKRH